MGIQHQISAGWVYVEVANRISGKWDDIVGVMIWWMEEIKYGVLWSERMMDHQGSPRSITVRALGIESCVRKSLPDSN